MKPGYAVGLDYGTNSVRAVVVDCENGRSVATHVADYASGEQGVLLDPKDPHLARQSPSDYIQGLRASVKGALAEAARERGLRAGATWSGSASTPPDRRRSRWTRRTSRWPSMPKWKGHLAAQAWLWKDHTGAAEAAAITETARRHAPQYLAPIGGVYSSEWFWSKVWRCLKVAPDVFDAAASWVELADFVPALLAGVETAERDPALHLRRRPQGDVLRRVGRPAEPRSSSPVSTRSWRPCGTASSRRPTLPTVPRGVSREPGRRSWASPKGSPVAMGGFDAHYGAVGAGVKTGTLVKIIGTSTCDCAIASAASP